MSVKELFKNTFIYGISFALTRFFVVFLVPVYTRVLSRDEFGALEIIFTGMNISALVLGLQIQSGTARFFYEAKAVNKAKDLVSTAFWAQWIVPITGVMLFIVFSGQIAILLKIPQNVHWIVLAAFIVPFSIQYEHNLLVYRLLNKPWQFLYLNTGKVLLSTVLIILFVLFFRLGISGVFMGELISLIVFFLVSTYTLKDFIGLRFSRQYLKDLLKYGIPLGPAVWSNWLQNSANRFIILGSLGLSQVAIYGLAFRISNLLLLVQYPFRMAWAPKAMEMIGHEESHQYYVKVSNIFMSVIGAVLVFLTVSSEVFIIIFAPKEYYNAVRFIGFIGTGIALSGIIMFYALGNNIVKKTYYNTIGFLLGAALNLGGLYFTINKFGLSGAAIWFVAGAIVAAVTVLVTSQINHRIQYSYKKFIFWVFMLVVISLWRLMEDFQYPNIQTLLQRLLFGCIFCLILFIIIISEEMKKLLKGWKK